MEELSAVSYQQSAASLPMEAKKFVTLI